MHGHQGSANRRRPRCLCWRHVPLRGVDVGCSRAMAAWRKNLCAAASLLSRAVRCARCRHGHHAACTVRRHHSSQRTHRRNHFSTQSRQTENSCPHCSPPVRAGRARGQPRPGPTSSTSLRLRLRRESAAALRSVSYDEAVADCVNSVLSTELAAARRTSLHALHDCRPSLSTFADVLGLRETLQRCPLHTLRRQHRPLRDSRQQKIPVGITTSMSRRLPWFR